MSMNLARVIRKITSMVTSDRSAGPGLATEFLLICRLAITIAGLTA
jgi:hypothetical protein